MLKNYNCRCQHRNRVHQRVSRVPEDQVPGDSATVCHLAYNIQGREIWDRVHGEYRQPVLQSVRESRKPAKVLREAPGHKQTKCENGR